MSVATYDPGLVNASFASIPLNSGLAPDTFIKIERDEESWTKKTGSDGFTTRTRNRNKGGKVIFTVMTESPLNDVLSAICAADELTGAGVGIFNLSELDGTTAAHAESAWIKKPADIERGKESGTTEYEIDCAELEMFSGGKL